MNSKCLFAFLLVIFVSEVYPICDYKTKCKCPSTKQGQYCGKTLGVSGCDPTHVYECEPYGKVCDYGFRSSCAECGNLTCSNQPPPSSTKPPQKQEPTIQNGEACVFHCKSCASGFGHVAWGFRIGNDNKYTYGSDDGPDNKLHECDVAKKWWNSSGTRAEMLSRFKRENYVNYYCKNTVNPNAEFAQKRMSELKTQKYFLNSPPCKKVANCLTDTYEILYAYNMLKLPSKYVDTLKYGDLLKYPNTWFEDWCDNKCWSL
ncbi:8771_t:CDS:2 [Gigaspora margarita]|uniref:8771_t:CDS:1 n=1 Tax=Gigaspora margarita TaxID=4874 RepID=A0ABN7VQ20_GIGMA|nr:8771_t:CDS:2 [Gigaspora margarita]